MQLDELGKEARAFQSRYSSSAPSDSPLSTIEETVAASDGLPDGLSAEDRAVVKSIVTASTTRTTSYGGQFRADSVDLKELEAEAISFRSRRHPEDDGRQ